jgi:hypothetical protein
LRDQGGVPGPADELFHRLRPGEVNIAALLGLAIVAEKRQIRPESSVTALHAGRATLRL